MNQIACIAGEHFLYWGAIILVLAALSGILLFLGLRWGDREDRMSGILAVPMALLLSILFSRLIHWYCRPEGYESLLAALSDYTRGGFALIGAFLGCLLTALILRTLGATKDLPGMLDHMALAGCLAIAAGRMGDLFSTADRGMLLPETVPFPWAVRMVNPVSGASENRLAVFLLQSGVAWVLLLLLLLSYGRLKKRKGDTCLVFLLCYCASQILLDSPRYDNLYFKSNGFVSIVQIFSLLAVLTVAGILLCRLGKTRGGAWSLLGLLLLPLLGLAGYMEYHVQRHGDQALFAYTVMGICLGCAVLLLLLIRALAGKNSRGAFLRAG